MTSNAYSILTTLGIEYESEDIAQYNNMPDALAMFFNTTHDASIEKNVNRIGSMMVGSFPSELKREVEQRQESVRYGVELVSHPIDTESENILQVLKELTSWLQNSGESPESYRAGIHVHVGMPTSLTILKAIVRLGRNMEDIFFHLGGQGYTYRGAIVNDSAYCRPITKWGPPVAHVRGDGSNYFAQCFNVEELLESKTTAEFWWRYGGLKPSYSSGMDRYNPLRYTWLNLYSLLYHGTLEFRVFNKTLNPYFIYSTILLCQKFCEYCLSSAFSEMKADGRLEEHSVYNSRTPDEMRTAVIEFGTAMNMSSVDMETLLIILERTPPVKIKEGHYLTHLEQYINGDKYLWNGERFNLPEDMKNYYPKAVTKSATPKIQDIHHLPGGDAGRARMPRTAPPIDFRQTVVRSPEYWEDSSISDDHIVSVESIIESEGIPHIESESEEEEEE